LARRNPEIFRVAFGCGRRRRAAKAWSGLQPRSATRSMMIVMMMMLVVHHGAMMVVATGEGGRRRHGNRRGQHERGQNFLDHCDSPCFPSSERAGLNDAMGYRRWQGDLRHVGRLIRQASRKLRAPNMARTRAEQIRMKFRDFSAGLLFAALIAMSQGASANVFICRPQCTDTHQFCASQCDDDRKCVARCTDTFNACLKQCDQASKTR
jgi:hypothetical protein